MPFAEDLKARGVVLCPACASRLWASANVVRWQEVPLVNSGLRYHQVHSGDVCSMLVLYVSEVCRPVTSEPQTDLMGLQGVLLGIIEKNLKMEGGFSFSLRPPSQSQVSEVCREARTLLSCCCCIGLAAALLHRNVRLLRRAEAEWR